MRILFDSHSLFWFLQGDARKLSRRARASIEHIESVPVASAVSAWEFANKYRLGKWRDAERVATTFIQVMQQEGIGVLPVSAEHAQLAGFLPGTHRDPFDRMLAAQSRIEDIPLVTADPVFKTFGTKVIW